jgi:hypothetical protein
MQFTYTTSNHNVSYLTAPYALLVKAFNDDGTTAPRDDYKSMAQWDVKTPHGTVEVYDYKVGKCYYDDPADGGLERHEITDWHVQGDDKAITYMIDNILSLYATRVGTQD